MSIQRVLPAAVAALGLTIASAAFGQAPPPPPPPARGQPQPVMLLTPVAIDRLQADDVVAVKGSVAEIFGNKFILQDGSGRALVELGPQGEDGTVVTKGEAVTVQGRFERGFIHAQLVQHADGRAQAFGPPREADRGPDRGPDRRPPPPPPPAPAR